MRLISLAIPGSAADTSTWKFCLPSPDHTINEVEPVCLPTRISSELEATTTSATSGSAIAARCKPSILSVRDCPDPREICSIAPAAKTGIVVKIKNMSNMTPVAKVFFTFLPPLLDFGAPDDHDPRGIPLGGSARRRTGRFRTGLRRLTH